MWPEIKRKLFHLTALLYVVGIIYLPRRQYVGILGLALAAVLLLETARLKVPRLNAWFIRMFGTMFRPQEENHLSGVPWMLAGVGLSAAIIGPLPLAASCILYLVLGDGVASLVGKRLGGPRWFGSSKRMSGSAACYAVCVIVGQMLIAPEFGWTGVLMGAFVATLIEGLPLPVDDNFSIPVGAALMFCFFYGILPFAGLWE